jgi:hypothetical protein
MLLNEQEPVTEPASLQVEMQDATTSLQHAGTTAGLQHLTIRVQFLTTNQVRRIRFRLFSEFGPRELVY